MNNYILTTINISEQQYPAQCKNHQIHTFLNILFDVMLKKSSTCMNKTGCVTLTHPAEVLLKTKKSLSTRTWYVCGTQNCDSLIRSRKTLTTTSSTDVVIFCQKLSLWKMQTNNTHTKHTVRTSTIQYCLPDRYKICTDRQCQQRIWTEQWLKNHKIIISAVSTKCS